MAEGSQAIEGYKCICGFITDDKTTFNNHLRFESLGHKGEHKSMGRVNMTTGDITMPPYNERTKEQRQQSKYAVKTKKPEGHEGLPPTETPVKRGRGRPSKQISPPPGRGTENLMLASEIKFVPRIYTCTFTPIMQQSWHAAVNLLGYRPDMPWENFLDTILFKYFKSIGINLGDYTVSDELMDFLREQENKGNGAEPEGEEAPAGG